MYCVAREERHQTLKAFMSYVGDSLCLQGQGQYIPTPFSRLFERRPDFDAETIINDVVARVAGE